MKPNLAPLRTLSSESLARLGAGNPKGVRLYESLLLKDQQPLLVLDRYLVPLGDRPVLSPMIFETEVAVGRFVSAALKVCGQVISQNSVDHSEDDSLMFTRWIGHAALTKLQTYALEFAKARLAS